MGRDSSYRLSKRNRWFTEINIPAWYFNSFFFIFFITQIILYQRVEAATDLCFPMTKCGLYWARQSLRNVFSLTVSDEGGSAGHLHPDVFNELVGGNVFTVKAGLIDKSEQRLFNSKPATTFFQIKYLTPAIARVAAQEARGEGTSNISYIESAKKPNLLLYEVKLIGNPLHFRRTKSDPLLLIYRKWEKDLPFDPARVVVDETRQIKQGVIYGKCMYGVDFPVSYRQLSPVHPRALLFKPSFEQVPLLLHISLVAWVAEKGGECFGKKSAKKGLVSFASFTTTKLKTLSAWNADAYVSDFSKWQAASRWKALSASAQPFIKAITEFASRVRSAPHPDEKLAARAVKMAKNYWKCPRPLLYKNNALTN